MRWVCLAALLAAGCGVAGHGVVVSPAAGPPPCGGTVSPDQLGAIHFLSDRLGVGLTLLPRRCGAQFAVSRDGGRHWVTEGNPLPGGIAGFVEQVAATSTTHAWAAVGTGRLMATADAGATWTALTPRGQTVALALTGRTLWTIDGGNAEFASASNRTMVLTADDQICLGGAAAGSSTKALFHMTEGRRTWTIASQITSLTAPPQPGGITLEEPSALAAASPTRLWLAALNNLYESADGGVRWSRAPGPDPQGTPTTFDVLSPTHAWLLAAGQGLWRTTDGRHWTALGPVAVSP